MLSVARSRRPTGEPVCQPSHLRQPLSQDNDWHSLRLGLAGQTQLTERLSLSGDVAFLFTRLDGKEQHHMRPRSS